MDLKHYRRAALTELGRVLESEPLNACDVDLDSIIRHLKGLPERPVGVEPYVRLFPAPPGTPRSLFSRLAVLVGPERAERFADGLEDVFARFDISTKERQAHFLAQVLHESGGLKYVEELWGPTPAQTRYEGRRDLGNSEEGDGYCYRGRGIIQLTGRANYRTYGAALGLPLEAEPERAAEPAVACLVAGMYWQRRNLNELADAGDVEAVTRRINGGLNGLADRRAWLQKVLDAS